MAEKSNKGFSRALALHVVLVAIGLSMVLPFVWMVLTSLKPAAEVDAPSWIPSSLKWENYPKVFEVVHFVRFYWNSVFIATWVTFLQVFTSALAAYAFSRLQWKGRDSVFLLYLATMMLPGIVLMIPVYDLMIQFGLVDTYTGLILPAAFSPFGTFLLRQFMMTIPRSLDEAASIDGASHWRIFWDIIMPLTRPGMITLTIFSFMGTYSSFFWPLVMLRSMDKYTLPIGLLFFDSYRGQSTHLMMAAVTLTIVPMIIAFIFLQKRMITGIQLGAVKG
jgi:multiple sugar transport system permease protein